MGGRAIERVRRVGESDLDRQCARESIQYEYVDLGSNMEIYRLCPRKCEVNQDIQRERGGGKYRD